MSKGICLSCKRANVDCPAYGGTNINVEECREFKPLDVQFVPSESHDPEHYKTDTVEAIDCIRAALGKDGFTAYCRGQVIRYNFRLGRKDAAHKEAKKALVYSQWLYDNLTDMPLTKDIK